MQTQHGEAKEACGLGRPAGFSCSSKTVSNVHSSAHKFAHTHLVCLHVVLAVSHEGVDLANIVLHELDHERHRQVHQAILPCNLHTDSCQSNATGFPSSNIAF